MKKLLMLLLAVTLVFGITACDEEIVVPTCEDNETLIDNVCVENEVPNVPPVLAGLDDVAIYTGATFDPNAGVTATDSEDGNLAFFVSGVINLNAAGTYTLTYTVTDSDGDTTTATRDVVVTVEDVAAIFTGVYDVNVVVHDTFDPLAGVTATDAVDGDVTADIVVTSDLDMAVVGAYTLTYTVTDSALNVATATRVVTVNAARINNLPTFAGLEDAIILVGGEFDPLAGVTAADFEDGDITADITVTGWLAAAAAVAGDYELVYTIIDSEGGETVETRIVTVNTLPVFSGLEPVELYEGDSFDPLEGVAALDHEDGILTASIYVTGTLDVSSEGLYLLTYSVMDSHGAVVTMTRPVSVLKVVEAFYTPPTGFFNFKFASTELRHYFMSVAESYLMNNMYAGIPLYASGGFNLYSSRLQLPVDEYVAVMGFGTSFATMSADDSTVLMDDGEFGVAGEYTYRTSISTNAGTWNQWIYDTATDSTLMGVYMDALYVYEFNDDKSGYEVVESMASGSPVAIDSGLTEYGKVISTTWQIPLRDDLVWYYHDDTDISGLAAGHEVIDANDFIETFKLALDEGWFRAISGGGDFLNTATGIENAQEYVDGEIAWSEVGLKVIDDLTIEMTFVNDMSDWNVRYFLSSFVMTPINIELYDSLWDDSTPPVNSYGTDEVTIAYHGAYYVDYYEADKIFRMLENPNFHSPDNFFFTGYTFSVIADATISFQEFVAGKLEGASLPTSFYDEYKDHPGIKQIPGAHEYRLFINALETDEAARAMFPEGSWVPEPILANQNFKMAMFFAVDRQYLAEEVLKTYTTNMFIFTGAYIVDAELGVPYRSTEEGISVGEGLSPSTHGFNPDVATAYFKAAIRQLIEEGTYSAGTAENPTIINIKLHNYANSESQALFGAYMKTTYEALFQDDVNHVYVEIEVIPRAFPDIYYDFMMVGEFDLSIGAISGSTLDAASFLDVFCSDNRSGFTLNVGIDTSIAEIPVAYEDSSGVYHTELWSYDAIVESLNGEVYLADGEVAEVPAPKDFVLTPTQITFTIELFESVNFQDFAYTVLIWELGTGYVPIPGYINIPATTATITVDGLHPAYYGYDLNGDLTYLGDYQIQVHFKYVSDLEKIGLSKSPDQYLPGLLTYTTDPVITDTTVTLDVAINEVDATRAIATITVLDYADDSVVAATIDFSDLTNITITGLTAETDYYIIFTFDDDEIDTLDVTTIATP